MSILDRHESPNRLARAWIIAAVVSAVVMGLPTLRGSFVGGDDQRLVLNHVLVNRPSLEHAVQLFTIVHRDLYQPLPLLTFSIEFLVAKTFGLFDTGVEGGAWLFHLSNVLLHALNSALVFLLLRRLHNRCDPVGNRAVVVAGVAAVLFAVHPFMVETVAWVNGRMMLLSTLFALCAGLALLRRMDGGGGTWAMVVMLCVLLSAISKVRAPLPILLAIIAVLPGLRPPRRLWSALIPALAVTGFFVWVNIGATSQADLFAEGAEHLRGPRSVRVILALAFYFEHLILPIGLTSYYPTPPLVSWSDTATWIALGKLLVACAIMLAAARRSAAARWGAIWFFVTIGDTLPFFPARNVLAADRYMYLPIIGLWWIIADAATRIHATLSLGRSTPSARAIPIVLGLVLLPLMIGVSWSTAKWYDTPLQKTLRVAICYPDEPRVWEMTGWSHYQLGQYQRAIECAEKELRHEGPLIRSGAYQLMGMAKVKLGRVDEGLALLRKSGEVDPTNDMTAYRLGMVLDDLGRYDEAAVLYEEAARTAPTHNPTLQKLAAIYRRLGRNTEARQLYERQLVNNPYEVSAVLGIVELDLADGSREALTSAESRLRKILDMVREHPAARVSLGVVLFRQGKTADAVEQYLAALHEEPGQPEAATNLARLLLAGDVRPTSVSTMALCDRRATDPFARAACAMSRLAEGRIDDALTAAASLQGPADSEARKLLLAALERYDQLNPDVPWTLALAVQTLIQDGNREAATTFLGIFAQRCKQPQCSQIAERLKKQVSAAAPSHPRSEE